MQPLPADAAELCVAFLAATDADFRHRMAYQTRRTRGGSPPFAFAAAFGLDSRLLSLVEEPVSRPADSKERTATSDVLLVSRQGIRTPSRSRARSASSPSPHPPRAEALLLIEAESGKVLRSENATQPWYPASVTKLMTTYVTLRAVKEGRISLDKLLTVSDVAVAQAPSKMGFPRGTTVTVDNALKMLLVKSANDMAVVLAEGVCGSVENFATEMNRAARRLGMTQTSYVNPNGLPADGQITSARDLAILARALIREFPEYDFYWHISAIKFGKKVFRNYNTLIDRFPGIDGMKTGFICASGYNLVASATRNGRRLIAVVLGAHSGMDRAEKAARAARGRVQRRRHLLAAAAARHRRRAGARSPPSR